MSIPFDQVIWDAGQCAEYLGVSKTHFLNAIQHAEGFPRPLSIPAYTIGGKERTMASRWKAQAVTSWALGEIPQDSRKSA